jgi:hypothetical protein
VGRNTFGVLTAATALGLWPLAATAAFHLEEATIADIHRAIIANELTATQLVGLYLKRIEAYNGQCVKGGVDPATGFVLGAIEPIEKAGKLGALDRTARGRRVTPDRVGAGWRGRLLFRAGGAVRNADNTTRKYKCSGFIRSVARN